jgi:outer membrane protein assembly factor BamB
LDLSDGSEQWSFSTGGYVTSGVAISNGTAVVGSNDNYVYGLDLSDGSEQWRFYTGDSVESGVAISNRTLVVGSDNNNVYGLESTKVHDPPKVSDGSSWIEEL